MKSKRMQRTRQAAIFTLLLFAASVAGTQIFGLVGSARPREDTPVRTEEPAGSTEVFAILPQAEESAIFTGFQAPLTGTVSSSYGYRNDPFSGETSYHKGVDVAVPQGTDVRAAAGGTVTASSYSSIGGNYIVLDHGNGIESYYGHLQTRTVSLGDTVESGQIIGLSGNTGRVTGAHLHFQLSYNDRTVDPQKYIDLTP